MPDQNGRGACPRRAFIRVGAGTLASLSAAPHVLRHRAPCPQVRRTGPPLPAVQRALLENGPALQDLAQRAIEAARAAGASYADARLTYTRDRSINVVFPQGIIETEVCHVGVRALVDGYWGFATHPYWTPDAVAWLGRAAVAEAKAHAGGPHGPVELGPVPRVTNGRWETPLAADPFALPVEEAWDRFGGLLRYCNERLFPGNGPQGHPWEISGTLGCWRELQVFASSEGSSFTQTRTRTRAAMQVSFATRHQPMPLVSSPPPFLDETARGLEAAIDEAAVTAWVPQAIEELQLLDKLPKRPVEVGRYDMAWDATSVGHFLGGSLGAATQVDRILGYEANAGGTSYLGHDPLAVVGTTVAAPNVTVMADRTKPGGLATVGWDAEGVVPSPYSLVKDGVLGDLQATRAEAAALSPYYRKAGVPATSKGSADAASAHGVPLTYTPNLVLAPGAGSAGLDELVRQLGTGLLLRRGQFTMDFQASTGFGQGQVFQVKGGKVVSLVMNVAALVRSAEVWGRVKALGGAASVEAHAQRSTKGEPPQETAYTVWAVPALIGEVTLMRAS